MKEEKDKWIDNFRNRMKDYSEPAPADLWDRLEEELDAPPKVIPMRRRWEAVAAVALLAVVSSLTVLFWQSPSADYIEQQSAELDKLPQPDELRAAPAATEQVMAQILPATSFSSDKQAKEAPAVTVVDDLSSVQTAIATEDKDDKEETLVGEQKAEQPAPEMKKRSSGRSLYSGANTYAYASTRKKQDKKWSVGLSTGNGTFSSSAQMDGYLSLPGGARNTLASSGNVVQTKEDIDKVVQFANLAEGEEGQSDVKYHMPVTVGLSFRRQLTDYWAIETGLIYTQLSSETRSGGKQNNYSWEDKLHYVGIPLKVNRTIWENKRFEVYASAGGAVEKCVSGKQTVMWNTASAVIDDSETAETDIKVKPLQWSLSAAAGAQFKITDRIGIYAEPGVVYYFDDGSSVNTIRKEHPFNFNVQLGLRLTLPK